MPPALACMRAADGRCTAAHCCGGLSMGTQVGGWVGGWVGGGEQLLPVHGDPTRLAQKPRAACMTSCIAIRHAPAAAGRAGCSRCHAAVQPLHGPRRLHGTQREAIARILVRVHATARAKVGAHVLSLGCLGLQSAATSARCWGADRLGHRSMHDCMEMMSCMLWACVASGHVRWSMRAHGMHRRATLGSRLYGTSALSRATSSPGLLVLLARKRARSLWEDRPGVSCRDTLLCKSLGTTRTGTCSCTVAKPKAMM